MTAATKERTEHWIETLVSELGEIDVSSPRARNALVAALSAALSTVAVLLLHLDNPWWASITGFVVSQATRAGSLRKGLLRISGTLAGATLAFLAMRWIGENHLACYVFLLGVTTVGVLGFQVSENSYAWLLFAVTADLVVLSSFDDPTLAFHVAVSRTLEVVVGTVAAFLVTQALASDAPEKPAAPSPGWAKIFDEQQIALRHAVSCGVSVMLIPPIWHFLELPSIGAQMGVSVIMVTAAPIQGVNAAAFLHTVETRAQHRLFGCLSGGAAALLCIGAPLTDLGPWLIALGAGVWLAAYLQSSTRGVGYIGTQFGMVFLMTLVQGFGPPTSIWPGLDRLAGILGSLALLYVVSAALWTPEAAETRSDAKRTESRPFDPEIAPAYSLRVMFLPRVFDRTVYVERLMQGGIDEKAAQLQAEALDAALRDCVSKHDLTQALRDMEVLRADLLQRLEASRIEDSSKEARARACPRADFVFWTFLVALMALAALVLATTRFGR
jgi:uncharacterized membrane protein YccC